MISRVLTAPQTAADAPLNMTILLVPA